MTAARSEPKGYVEYAPSPALVPYAECFWSLVDEDTREPKTILPDGCADLIFDLGASGRPGMVSGTMTRPLRVRLADPVRLVAVRFRPGGARPFLGRPLHEWTDASQPLHELWPDCAQLEDALSAATTGAAAAGVLQRELERRLQRIAPVDARILVAIERVWARPAEVRVADLGREVGLSRQHLTRRFRDACGIGPKRLARVGRLRRLLAGVPAGGAGDWARAAAWAGYYDQSHLIGEFRELTGETPGRYFARG